MPKPIVGAPRDQKCRRTVSVIKNKIAGLAPLHGNRILDVGCGEGTFTEAIAGPGYEEVWGIDVQAAWLDRFRQRVVGRENFHIEEMSASEMSFPDKKFDTILSVETIEHIPDLPKACSEMARVLKSGGDLVLTCPNRWFPFENHGIRWRGREIDGRVPLITYIPPIHDRFSLARVFTVRRLRQLFEPHGLRLQGVDYAWPTFEHGGNHFQPVLRRLFGLMRTMECSPLRMFGSSVVARFVKS